MNLKNSHRFQVLTGFYAMVLLLGLLGCNNKDSLIGFGILHFEPKEEATLEVYQDSMSDSLLFEVEARFSNTGSRLYLKSYLNDSGRFNPVKYAQLRGFLSLRVLDSEKGRLKVVTNEQTQEYGWVEGTLEQVEDWESFLMSLHHIESIGDGLHKTPGSNTLIDISGNICLSVIEVQESWIKVDHDITRCDDRNVLPTGPAGFIQWKREGKVVIYFRM